MCLVIVFALHFLVPVMFLATVESIDPLHFLLRQFKIKQFRIFLNMIRIAGTGNDYDTLLQIPPEYDLRL